MFRQEGTGDGSVTIPITMLNTEYFAFLQDIGNGGVTTGGRFVIYGKTISSFSFINSNYSPYYNNSISKDFIVVGKI